MKPFGPWNPDVYNLNEDLSGEALNVLPGTSSWHPWPQLVTQSLALATACRGSFVARATDTGAITIFAGTATKLYKFVDSATAWTDVTAAAGNYTLATDIFWQFCQFGSIVIAVAKGQAPQAYTLGSSTQFAALGGSPPTAAYVAVISDFVVLGDLGTPSDGGRSSVQWCANNDCTTWTKGSKGADIQTFPDGGFVTGLSSMETGLILQAEATRRFVRVAERAVFNFARIEGHQGTSSPYSIIEHAGVLYYRGIDGFVASAAGAYTGETGIEFIDDWFAAEANLARLGSIIGALDPTRPRLVWLFPSLGNGSTTLDRAIGYDVKLQQWFHGNFDAEYLFSAATAGSPVPTVDTVTGVAVDDYVDVTVDGVASVGGVPNFGAYTSAHKLAFFTGTPLAATLRTTVWEPIPGRRAYTNGFRLIGDATLATGKVGTTENPQTAIIMPSQARSVNSQGRIPARASGRYMQHEVTVAAGATWNDIQGLDFDEGDLVPDGTR